MFGGHEISGLEVTENYTYLQYEMKGALQCEDKNLLYMTSADATCSAVSEHCDFMQLVPNERNCFVRCACPTGSCNVSSLVYNNSANDQWSFCQIAFG